MILTKNHPEIAWKELIKLNKEAGWHFGQYDKDRKVETAFSFHDDETFRKFQYEITQRKMIFSVNILQDFEIDSTHDIMILASHFNSLLNNGIIRVNTSDRQVYCEFTGEILLYVLYPGEIQTDILQHYNLAKDCCWAFNHLLVSGEDPVFIIAELLKRKEEENKEH